MNIIMAWETQRKLQEKCPHKKTIKRENVGGYILREHCTKCGMITRSIFKEGK